MKTMFATAAALLLAAACGGGKKDVDAQLTRADARPQVDSPIIPASCTVETTVTEAPNPDPTAGNTAVLRVQSNDTPPVEEFEWNYVVVGTGTLPDFFVFLVPFDAARPVGQQVPAADFNADLPLIDACTANADYCMFLLSDYDNATGMETQFFWPNTGTIKITNANDVGVGTGDFTVEMTAARFDEYDAASGEQIDSDGDGTSDCNGTVAANGPTTITVQLPSVAPQTGAKAPVGGKWGKFTRPAHQ
jgi:hypothetical protein